MKHAKHSQRLTRDTILKLLSDDEAAAVNSASGATLLSGGDEYIDLDELKGGVRRALAATTRISQQVIAKNGVHQDSWNKILAELASYSGA